jgi:putative membrane protein
MFITEIVTLNARGDWDGPGAWWPIFPIFWFLVIAAIVTYVVVRSRGRAERAGRYAGEQRLAERYAAGEIDADEYEARREVLRRKPRKS